MYLNCIHFAFGHKNGISSLVWTVLAILAPSLGRGGKGGLSLRLKILDRLFLDLEKIFQFPEVYAGLVPAGGFLLEHDWRVGESTVLYA